MSLRREPSPFDHAGLSKGGQAFQQGLNGCGAGPGEVAGEFGGGGFAHVLQCGADGGYLVWQAGGPGRFGSGGGGADGQFGLFALGGGMTCGVLVIGSQPADRSAGLFDRTGAVEGEEVLPDRIFGQVSGPALGRRCGSVYLVVQVFQDADPALIVNLAVLPLDPFARPQLFKAVVHAGQGQFQVLSLARFAVGVEVFAEGAQVGLLSFGRFGEWKRVEASRFIVSRIITVAETSTGSQCPDDMKAAGQDGKLC